MIPIFRASVRSDASSSRTPKRRIGSASPRNALPIAMIVSSGDALLNDARSAESSTSSLENPTSSSPDNPAALPKIANWAAASIACCLDCPSDVAAVSAHSSICPAPSSKISPVLVMVSFKLEAFWIASLIPPTADLIPVIASLIAPKPRASAAPAAAMPEKLVFIEELACFVFRSILSTLALALLMVLVKPLSVAPKSTLMPAIVYP